MSNYFNQKSILIIDNYDSFTHILNHYFLITDCLPTIIRNNISLKQIDFNKFSGLVISPGPGTPSSSNLLMQNLEWAWGKCPILGVCLGMQAIGEYTGAIVKHGSKPFHGKQTDIIHNSHEMFNKVPSPFKAGRYHSLIIQNIPENEFEITAYSLENEAMAIAHRNLPITAVQFHPESCMTENSGLQIIKNWANTL